MPKSVTLALPLFAVWLAAVPALAEQATSERYLHDVVATSPVHEKNLRSLLRGTRTLPSWVRNMVSVPRYVSGGSKAVNIDGKPMELFGACLARRCPQNHLRILFSEGGAIAGMRIVDEKLGEVVLGSPSADALAALKRDGI
ncbi:Ivy family c-type lysozyme inhibitor [Rhizobium sp. SAFR-030]|uniref:Ivy family c-type lysozyme inhibitor n=1 Tax=Rhizobium sp. SAFR-030 TaxID=3387277 RepID=UPI003F80ABF1